MTTIMATTTLGEILNGFIGERETNYRIYIISADDTVLYVGKSKDAITRVLSHLGSGDWSGFYGSDFDKKLKTLDGWENFSVSLFTCEDSNVDEMENNLIYELSPVYNSMGKKKSRESTIKWYLDHPEPTIDCAV